MGCFVCKNNGITYFDSFGVKHISKEIKKFINGFLYITKNVYRIQAYDSIMCGCFIDFMLKGTTLVKYTNLFSPNNFKKNDSIILSYFKDE